ncbi:DNA-binding FadR family transcriptional regulator [Agromyces terreus]|uniref:DNA-binding FadR family transcriptional regulator n=1 Tax=Agromyces terreus TaxID=424795 RepID=A0A9X2GZC0_9MICO|nr:FadR/GntR family transcriptional regulator [Agromyces terreus]MCP2369723.1 DNA-binding FadR family transcriptional regulator [Agromyces terreus]
MSESFATVEPLAEYPTLAARARAPRLGVTVVAALVDAIVRGDLEPGTSLPPEGVLCEQFGVSRTVIRESAKRLEEKGLVSVAQGRGTTVLPPTSWNMVDATVLGALVANDATLGTLDDLAVVRASLEAITARDAATRRTDNELARLRDALVLMRETIGDEPSFNQADVVFHEIVGEITANRLADSIVRTLFTEARASARFHLHSELDITLREHERVFAAIEAQDADEAEAAMRSHIVDAWERRRPPSPKR